MSNRRKAHLDSLEHRLTGPKRIALFGHRAVGKTTLLAMFYRQASTGQVPGLRLAAVDPPSAEYLAEKIAQIESGEPPAGT
jgi:ATPase subunit of ABC transporter with duplicated ATPase domains